MRGGIKWNEPGKKDKFIVKFIMGYGIFILLFFIIVFPLFFFSNLNFLV